MGFPLSIVNSLANAVVTDPPDPSALKCVASPNDPSCKKWEVEAYYGSSDEYKNTDTSSRQESVPIHRYGVRGFYNFINGGKYSLGVGAGLEFGYGSKAFDGDSFTLSPLIVSLPIAVRGRLSLDSGLGLLAQVGWSVPLFSSDDNRTGGSEKNYKREWASTFFEFGIGASYINPNLGFGINCMWNPIIFGDSQNIDGSEEIIEIKDPLKRFQCSLTKAF